MKKLDTKSLVVLGLLVAIQILFSFTPIGTIPVGPLSITLQTIPIAIAAVTLGPIGGLIMGCTFGLLSFLQCVGVGIPSAMGVTLFNINPFLAFIQRFVPRALDGFLAGMIFKGVDKAANKYVACAVTGFGTAFMNTVFFMSALILLFRNTDYMQELMGEKPALMFIISFVGINAVVEMITTTVFTAAIGTALFKAKLVNRD